MSSAPGSFLVSSDVGSYFQAQSSQLSTPNINGTYLVPPNSISKLPSTPSSAAKIGQIQNQIQSPGYNNSNPNQSHMISQVRSVDSGIGPYSGQRHVANSSSNASLTDTRSLLSQSGMSTHGALPLSGALGSGMGLVSQSLGSLTSPYSLGVGRGGGGASPPSKRNQNQVSGTTPLLSTIIPHTKLIRTELTVLLYFMLPAKCDGSSSSTMFVSSE